MAQAIPTGHEGLIPHICVKNASEAIEYYKKAFGAEESCRMPTPDGSRLMHAELMIGGKPLYLADDFPEYCGGKSRTPDALGGSAVTIHMYVEDCDAAIKRATDAGGTVTMPPSDMFWGDRYGKVKDPFGHEWSIATHIADPTPEEMEEAASKMFG